MSNCSRSIDISTPRTPAPHTPITGSSGGSFTSSSSPTQERDSPDAEHPEPFILSGTNTPIQEDGSGGAKDPYRQATGDGNREYPRLNDAVQGPRGMPILPTRKYHTVAVTPPAPLSTTGDVTGGYFPFHEDSIVHVHGSRPFHLDASQPRSPSPNGKGKRVELPTTPTNPTLVLSSDAAEQVAPSTDALVTSYVPSGIHGSSLPMGKYYPSNYEKRTRRQKGLTVPISSPISTKSAPQVPTYSSTSESKRGRDDGDAKRKLQQYQRDMIAQATLAARKVLGNSGNPTLKLPGFPMPGMPVSAPATANPLSPRLRPLGSPGPVTPMELEAADGSYLDKGRGSNVAEQSNRNADCSRALASEERMRSGTRSPSMATPAC